MKYRISIETEASGKQWFYPQKRVFFIWVYFYEKLSPHYCETIRYDSLESAKRFVEVEKEIILEKKQKKIIQKEIYNSKY